MAIINEMQHQPPGEIEALLPWHATRRLNARDTDRIAKAISRERGLARQFAAIQEECAGTVLLNENLGAPSPRAMLKLFAAIDAEPTALTGPLRRHRLSHL